MNNFCLLVWKIFLIFFSTNLPIFSVPLQFTSQAICIRIFAQVSWWFILIGCLTKIKNRFSCEQWRHTHLLCLSRVRCALGKANCPIRTQGNEAKKTNMAACKGVIAQLVAKRFNNLRVFPWLLRTNRHEIHVKVYNCSNIFDFTSFRRYSVHLFCNFSASVEDYFMLQGTAMV